MFDKIADFIMKHSKAIIVFWIIVLIASIPFALNSNSVMKYDLNDMAADDSESIQGLVMIGTYFPSAQVDSSSMQILVLKYDDQTGHDEANAFVLFLDAEMLLSKEWREKLTGFVALPSEYPGTGTAITLVGAIYQSHDITFVTNDTPNLRAFINECYEKYSKDIGEQPAFESYLTGSPAISYDMSVGATADIERIDPFTVLMILILVGLFFRSFISSATPPLTIGFAFVVVLALIFGIGTILNVFFITEMMLLVSMMGAGCDYCIFIISRYREELREGKPHEEALRESIIWAGESIATSACSVIIGFGAMAICSYSLVSTMGICLAVGIIVALLAALTLIPSVLNVIRDRVFWPTTIKEYSEGGKATRGWYAWFGKLGVKYFDASARFSKKYAIPIVIVAILVTVPAAYIMFTTQTSYDMVGSMQSGDSGKGMDLLGEYGNEGMLMPDYAVIEYNVPVAYVAYIYNEDQSITGLVFWNTNKVSFKDIDKMMADIKNGDDNVGAVSSYFNWANEYAQYSDKYEPLEAVNMVKLDLEKNGNSTGALALEAVIAEMLASGMPIEEIVANNNVIDYYMNCQIGVLGGDFVQKIPDTSSFQAKAIKAGLEASGYTVEGVYDAQFMKVTMATKGAAMSPTSMDTIGTLKKYVNDYMESHSDITVQKWVTGSAVVMYDVSETISKEFTMIEILVVVLIIVLLFFVMKSYLIPLRSVLTILMSISWTIALTHIVFTNILGGEVTWLIPLILLVICLGLGMDYDILLTTRIKENVSKGESNDDAIYHAVTHTGSVITICGLIMGGAFGTLMLSRMEMMQEFGFALCFAILVDALVVRTYIVPAVMHILGDWNWKGPSFLKRSKA